MKDPMVPIAMPTITTTTLVTIISGPLMWMAVKMLLVVFPLPPVVHQDVEEIDHSTANREPINPWSKPSDMKGAADDQIGGADELMSQDLASTSEDGHADRVEDQDGRG